MSTMFSSKGRYALRAMADMASHDGWVSLGDIASRQRISRKYLDHIISILLKADFIESRRGKDGGYRLTKKPEDYTVGQILRVIEGPITPVACLECTNDEICPIRDTCPTIDIWIDLGKVTSAFLDSKTLADLIKPKDKRLASLDINLDD